MRAFNRICVLVLDGFGVGSLPDAKSFGDEGAHTLKSVSRGLRIPTLERLGIFEVGGISKDLKSSSAFFSKMRETSAGKDTTTGHWEMMGLPLYKAFDYFPNGFPAEVMDSFMKATGVSGYLANCTASGTEIIDRLGAEHLKTGHPIVYTSADSVLQIAAHEESFGLQRLYEVCEQAREMLNKSGHNVGRVIARPFLGDATKFFRTKNRHDYSIAPPGDTSLSLLKKNGYRVLGIGKVPSIFDHQGFTDEYVALDDEAGIAETKKAFQSLRDPGLIFSNLNDLDTLYGHRRNVDGYKQQLQKIDEHLESLMKEMREDDLLIITADHGNDPAFKGTDHTREYVPLLMWSPRFVEKPLETAFLAERTSFADIGKSILDNFAVTGLKAGVNFWADMKEAP